MWNMKKKYYVVWTASAVTCFPRLWHIFQVCILGLDGGVVKMGKLIARCKNEKQK